MRKHTHFGVVLLAAGLMTAACEDGGADSILRIDAAGSADLLVYLDRDGNDESDASIDAPVAGVKLFLVRAVRDTVATATTDAAGRASIAEVPVGDYRVAVDPAVLGDSLEMGELELRVMAADSVHAALPLRPRVMKVEEARNRSPGTLLAIEGLALNAWSTFGDSTLHVVDSSGTLRVLALPPAAAIAAGDSVRVLGRTSVRDGEPILAESKVFLRGQGTLSAPVELGSGVAARAEGQGIPFAHVRVVDATVIELSAAPGGDVRLLVDDGTGLLEVLLDRDAGIRSETPLLAGVVVDVSGLLVPTEAGVWRLKPRSSQDLAARVPTATLREARHLAPGRLVQIEGIALNGWAAFGDATLHLADSTGALRALQVSSSAVFVGDSVRLIGRTAVQEGQTVLVSISGRPPSILARLPAPASLPLESAVAALADSARADAMLVRVADATVQDTATVAGEFRFSVDDGSGPLVVLLDRDTGIGSGSLAPNVTVDVTGVLVPVSGGWILKPRQPDDLSIR